MINHPHLTRTLDRRLAFVERLEARTLPGGVAYGLTATSRDDAEAIMDRVLKYHAA